MEWISSASLQAPDKSTARTGVSAYAVTLLVCWFTPSLFCSAQAIVWSPPTRNERAIDRVRAVLLKDTILHVIEEREDHVLRWIHYGWKSLQIVRSTDIMPVADDYTLEYFFILNDTLHTLSSVWNGEEDCTEIIAQRHDLLGKTCGDPIMVHKRPESSEPRRSGLQCVLSPDSARTLLYFDSENERRQSEGIHFKLFDAHWQLQWEKELRLPASPEVLQVHHFLLDNQGGVYMMSGRTPNKASADWQRPQGGQYVVYYFDFILNKLKQYDISLKDKQVISVGFALNSAQEIIIAGYYSNNFQNNTSGTLLFMLGANGGQINTASYTPFNGSFLKEMSGKEKGVLENFYLDHLHLTGNGSIVLVGEQYYTSRYVSTDPTTGRQMVEYRYNFDDVMVCLMDSSAKHLWNRRVPKRQFTSTMLDPNFSYSFAADSLSIALTFNDDASNNPDESTKSISEAEVWSGSKNSITTRVEMDYSGGVQRETLVDNNKERLLLNPLMIPSAMNQRLLLGFDDKRTYKFCRIR